MSEPTLDMDAAVALLGKLLEEASPLADEVGALLEAHETGLGLGICALVRILAGKCFEHPRPEFAAVCIGELLRLVVKNTEDAALRPIGSA